jgi:hypothetical protein
VQLRNVPRAGVAVRPHRPLPNQGEHLVRYYGWYSNASRGKRKTTHGHPSGTVSENTLEVPSPTPLRALRQRWAHVIKPVSEGDPLRCLRCGHPLWIRAFSGPPALIETRLAPLGCGPAPAHGRKPLAIDMSLPSVPALERDLGARAGQAQKPLACSPAVL